MHGKLYKTTGADLDFWKAEGGGGSSIVIFPELRVGFDPLNPSPRSATGNNNVTVQLPMYIVPQVVLVIFWKVSFVIYVYINRGAEMSQEQVARL